jgi:hypothetical protein
MDESKLKTNVKRCGECAVIHYIFCVMYGKNSVCCNVFDNKKCLS